MSDRFSQLLPILGAIVAFLFAALLLVYIFRLVFGRRIRAPGARNRPRRLDVVDVFDLDKERQLVIVRRDNTEHLLMIGGPNDVLVEASINRVEGVLARTAGAATAWPSAPGSADADIAEPAVPRPSSQVALNLPPELFEPEAAPEPASTRPPAPPRIEPPPSEPVRPAPPPPPRAPAAPPNSTAASATPNVLPATGAASAAAPPLRPPPAPTSPPRPPAPPAPGRPAPPPFLSRAQQRPGPPKPEAEPSAGLAPNPGSEAPLAPRPAPPRPAPPPLRPPPLGQPGPQGGGQAPFPPRPAAPRPPPPVAAPADAVDTLEEEMARLLGRPEQE